MTHLRHPEAAAPETKALSQAEEFDNLNRLVGEYRSENDDRRAAADPLQAEKLARMDRAIDLCMDRIRNLETKGRRPALGFGQEGVSLAALEHKSAFDGYMRSGETQALHRLEMKAANMTAPDGGYLLPPLTEESVLARIAGLSPIRSIAGVQSISGSSLRKAVTPTGAQSGWTGDAAPGNAVQASAFVALDFPTGELFTQPAATQTMLDDAAVDIQESSRRASSPTPPWRRPAGVGTISALSQPVRRVPLRLPTPRTACSISRMP